MIEIIIEILLSIAMTIIGFCCPYIQWEIFASPNTLYEFRDNIFIMICILMLISILSYMNKFKSRKLIQFVKLTLSGIIVYEIINTSNVIAHLSDGTIVEMYKRIGFNLELALSVIYTLIVLINVLCKKKKQ